MVDCCAMGDPQHEGRRLEIRVGEEVGSVAGLLVRPSGARALLVLGHGAGSGMEHPFLASVAEGLARRGVATLRYRFPYRESGKNWPPDRPPVLRATVRAAAAAARTEVPELPLWAGGRSLGGRMTSQTQVEEALGGVRGLVFLGFPLHPKGKPGTDRAEHLAGVTVPMLFVQGSRDELADLELLRPVVKELGGDAELHVVEGADHGFGVRKKDGRSGDEVLAEVTETVAAWIGG